MFWRHSNYAHPEFQHGWRDFRPLAPGIAAWGLMTGVAMVKSGLSIPVALVMSLLVFAGSAQLAVIPLLAAGAPVWLLWATAACVNLRFLILSTQWRPYFGVLPRVFELGAAELRAFFHRPRTAAIFYLAPLGVLRAVLERPVLRVFVHLGDALLALRHDEKDLRLLAAHERAHNGIDEAPFEERQKAKP
jgi:hypothetical protein